MDVGEHIEAAGVKETGSGLEVRCMPVVYPTWKRAECKLQKKRVSDCVKKGRI